MKLFGAQHVKFQKGNDIFVIIRPLHFKEESWKEKREERKKKEEEAPARRFRV